VAEEEKRPKSRENLSHQLGIAGKADRRSEAAFQRPMIRKKIRELSILFGLSGGPKSACHPRCLIMIAEKRLKFHLPGKIPTWGCSRSRRAGILRCLDGQHRL